MAPLPGVEQVFGVPNQASVGRQVRLVWDMVEDGSSTRELGVARPLPRGRERIGAWSPGRWALRPEGLALLAELEERSDFTGTSRGPHLALLAPLNLEKPVLIRLRVRPGDHRPEGHLVAVSVRGYHLLLASEIAYWATDDDNAVYLPLRAFAVLALDVRLLRLIYLSPKLGALVLLLVRMTVDLLKLFVLLIFVVFSLVSALYVVEQATWRGDDLDRAERTPACDDFYILGGSWTHWGKLLFLVLNAVVDGRAQDALFMCAPLCFVLLGREARGQTRSAARPTSP